MSQWVIGRFRLETDIASTELANLLYVIELLYIIDLHLSIKHVVYSHSQVVSSLNQLRQLIELLCLFLFYFSTDWIDSFNRLVNVW